MEWVFAQIDGGLQRRRLDELAGVGRLVPPVGPPRAPVLLGVVEVIAGVGVSHGNG